MEKGDRRLLFSDDTVFLLAEIEAADSTKGHTEYELNIQRGPLQKSVWKTSKRYNAFAALEAEIQWAGLSLPPKKVFGNKEREFIAARQEGLQNFLNSLTLNPFVMLSFPVRRFLDEDNYPLDLSQQASQQISMLLRTDSDWKVDVHLPDIGWRIRKHYYGAKSILPMAGKSADKYLLTWSNFGPDKQVPSKELPSLLRSLGSIEHRNVLPVVFTTMNEQGLLIIKKACDPGSIRDVISKTKPFQHTFHRKYGNPKSTVAFSIDQIRSIGRDILNVLQCLHEKGLWFGHLHSGNVVLDGDIPRLTDLENSLIGVPSLVRPFMLQLKKLNNAEAIDAYCFGRILYEMTFGIQLMTATIEYVPAGCQSNDLVSLLESLLTKKSIRAGLPTLQSLTSHKFFDSSLVRDPPKVSIKVGSKLRPLISGAKSFFESRLQEEQKLVHQYNRLSKAKATHLSQEAKQSRQKLRQREALRSDSSAGLPVTQASIADSELRPGTAVASETNNNEIPTAPPPPPSTEQVPTCTPDNIDTHDHSAISNTNGENRGALLSSIRGFSKSGLKHSATKSADQHLGTVID